MFLHKFELNYNTIEATENICCTKDEDTVDHSTVTRQFKKFRSVCKNLDNQGRSGRPKRMDSKAVLLAIDANSVSNT